MQQLQWVLWSGTVGLESPLLDRFPAAVTGGYDVLSLSPLDVARAADHGLTAPDIGRRAGDDGLGLIVDPVMNWHPAAEPSASRFAWFSVDEALRMSEEVGAISLTAIASSAGAAPADELVELFGALCDRAADVGARFSTAEVDGSLWDDTQHRLLPGDGSFDLPRVLRTLVRMGGLRFVGPEIISPETAAMPAVEAARVAGERVRALVADALEQEGLPT